METRPEPRPSCFARMLDVRGYVIAARRATLNASPAAALVMLIAFGIITLCLLPLWIAFDLSSTWEFTTSLRDASEYVISDATSAAGGFLGLSLAAVLSGVILTSYTLLPSLFEIAFPTVNHPLLNLFLLASIVFDFVTDWGKSWEVTDQWGNADNPVVHTLYSWAFCMFVSVGVQALLVVCLTVVAFSVVAIVRGGAQTAHHLAVIEPQQ